MPRKIRPVSLLAGVLLAVTTAGAAVLPSRPREAPERPVRTESADGRADRQRVAAVLASLGLPPEQVEERLAELSYHDLRHLAAHPEQIRSGGGTTR